MQNLHDKFLEPIHRKKIKEIKADNPYDDKHIN